MNAHAKWCPRTRTPMKLRSQTKHGPSYFKHRKNRFRLSQGQVTSSEYWQCHTGITTTGTAELLLVGCHGGPIIRPRTGSPWYSHVYEVKWMLGGQRSANS